MRRLAVCLFLACISAGFLIPGLNAQEPASYKADPKFVAAVAEAKALVSKRDYRFAIDAYKKANKIADGKDAACLKALMGLQSDTGDAKAAVASAAALEAIATTPEAKADAAVSRGIMLYRQAGEKAKPELLHAADDSFKTAMMADPKNPTAHYLDGQVLARLGEMEAARGQFQSCLSCMTPKDPSYARAQHFAERPELSTAKMAPAFTVTSLDGTQFNLDAMNGRVVLIDFWATWCGPCNAELPHMKKIAKEFAGQPLVIISVSWDADETKWKDFIAKNEMNWVQYRDADHVLSKRFGVEAIPHYFTIDSDGVLTAEMMGTGSDVEGKLKKLVARAKAAGAVAPLTASVR